jgi:hypothetical protein
VIRKYGTKDSGVNHLEKFYKDILTAIEDGVDVSQIAERLQSLPGYGYLQPEESPYDGVVPTRMSSQVKAGLTMKKLLETAPRCALCRGFVPSQAITVDHIERSQDGGKTTSENTQLAHPYCNSGFKESRIARERKLGQSETTL